MILVDPKLEPESGPNRTPRNSAAGASAGGRRLPSARTFARFLDDARTVVRLRGEVNVLLTTDGNIRALNRRFRGKNKATDVLSFPADAFVQTQEKFAGDLAISVPTAHRQSMACGHSLGTEIKVLILHGLLHLAGYDHERDDGQMARREQTLRARLGLPQGLIERAAAPTLSPGKKRAKAGPSTRASRSHRMTSPNMRELAQDGKSAARAGSPRRRKP